MESQNLIVIKKDKIKTNQRFTLNLQNHPRVSCIFMVTSSLKLTHSSQIYPLFCPISRLGADTVNHSLLGLVPPVPNASTATQTERDSIIWLRVWPILHFKPFLSLHLFFLLLFYSPKPKVNFRRRWPGQDSTCTLVIVRDLLCINHRPNCIHYVYQGTRHDSKVNSFPRLLARSSDHS